MLARAVLLLGALPLCVQALEAANLVTVAGLTPVAIRIDEPVSSNRNKPGDRFRISVAEDVRIDDVLVIPKGAVGEGEIIHAAKSGAGGKAGELILAARYVRVGDVDVRLRSFALGVAGKDQTNGSLAASMVIGPLAMFVRGGVVTIPAGTLGLAKTAVETRLQAVVSTTPPPDVPTEEPNKGGGEDEKVD